jgi:hypothetical protein
MVLSKKPCPCAMHYTRMLDLQRYILLLPFRRSLKLVCALIPRGVICLCMGDMTTATHMVSCIILEQNTLCL